MSLSAFSAGADSQLYAWGDNAGWQLGIPGGGAYTSPHAVGFALDVTGPVTQALKNVTTRRGASVKLSYRLTDEYCRACSTVRLVVRKASGAQAAAFSLGERPTGSTLSKTFVCKLARGTYTWSLTAVDSAGNVQRSAVARRLVVR